mmetsp:Transcript_67390/g.173513  ORF Transcript_67390/g.173513 Transcript_67390/m.173513 type:complete len:329 (+) Transcript_67390:56-1042(+)
MAAKLEQYLSVKHTAAKLEELKDAATLDEISLEALLLEDPSRSVAEDVCYDDDGTGPACRYRQCGISWTPSAAAPPAGVDAHEVSQAFERMLLGGRWRSFRLHRFTLVESLAHELNEQLVATGHDLAATDPGKQVSNVGGYHSNQDLFERAEGRQFRDLCADCVRAAARVTCQEAGLDRDEPQEGCEPYAWVNVSGVGHANQLHSHHGATLACCYYARVPSSVAHLDGTLLLRLSPAEGASQDEPDEERHVRWMAPAEAPEDQDSSVVKYVEILPSPGSLIVFPAWLSHSVAPMRGAASGETRISVAANFDFAVPSDDYPPGWTWFGD